MKRILIDGRFIGVGDSIARYTLEILKGILKIDQKNEYTLLIRPVGQKYVKDINFKNLKVEVLDVPHYSLAEQSKLLTYLTREKYDLVHFTQFNHPVLYKGNYVVTIHDLTLIGHLHRQNLLKSLAYHTVMKSAITDSKKIIAISKTTKEDLIDYKKFDLSKIKVIYHGIDHDRFNTKAQESSLIDKFKKKYEITGDYVLYTGMWKRHKNLLGLLKAFKDLRTKNSKIGVQLVLVGKVDTNETEVVSEIERINKEIAGAIVTTGFIEDPELPTAYAGALCYVIPSFAEGFGWPPLEAMACGTAVAASKESCIPEILEDAAIYFDPYNTEEMKNQIQELIVNQALRKSMIKKGLEQVTKFNWPDCIQETLGVYKEVLGLDS